LNQLNGSTDWQSSPSALSRAFTSFAFVGIAAFQSASSLSRSGCKGR
jgi:hypothetical protein